jgi:hypothetical protein
MSGGPERLTMHARKQSQIGVDDVRFQLAAWLLRDDDPQRQSFGNWPQAHSLDYLQQAVTCITQCMLALHDGFTHHTSARSENRLYLALA